MISDIAAIRDAEKRGRIIGRRLSDVALHEIRIKLDLTKNALVAAIQMLESGQRDKTLIDALKTAALQAGEA